MRQASVERDTSETRIRASINLDGIGTCNVNTGIGFLDHMLDQIARHGLMDLDIESKGDLHIDFHHTTEDVGIALGQAFKQALGNKKGIRRYASCLLPMDETLARVALDLSNRPYLVWNVEFTRDRIGRLIQSCFASGFRLLPSMRGLLFTSKFCMVLTIIT